MVRSIPKYFDFRIDTIVPEIGQPVFLELHKFTEIRWDPTLQLEEPAGAQSIFSIKPS